ncbi:MAG TPA: SRPBCC family protein [Rubrobacter sp.]|nr:SRPBCC family protein [Rubrobacter sp.]
MSGKGSVAIEERIAAPPEMVAAFVGDFRNAKRWMVGVEGIEPLGNDAYKLEIESPVGKIHPEVRVLEHSPTTVRWVYDTAVEGGGRVDVVPDADGGCLVSYEGEFHLKSGLLDRAARLVGAERFARNNGERSLAHLKHLMEAHRLG